MATYLWMNPDRFRKVGKELRIDGVELHVQLSPFDVPSGVTGTYHPSTGEFVIRFDYIDNEPPRKATQVTGLRFEEGRYSGKLLAIHIPVDRKPLDDIAVIGLRTQAVEAINERTGQLKSDAQTEGPLGPVLNWEAARDVVEEDFSALAQELAAT